MNKELKVTAYIKALADKNWKGKKEDVFKDMAFGNLPSLYVSENTYRVIHELDNTVDVPVPALIEVECLKYWSILRGYKNGRGIYRFLYLLEDNNYYLSSNFTPTEKNGGYDYNGTLKKLKEEEAFYIINYIEFMRKEN